VIFIDKWDEVEKYLSGFSKVKDNDIKCILKYENKNT